MTELKHGISDWFFYGGSWLIGGEGLPFSQRDPFAGSRVEARPISQLRLARSPASVQEQRLETHAGERRPMSSGQQGVSQRAKI